MKMPKAAAFFALALLASGASAQTTPPAGHIYVGGAVGQSRWSPPCTSCDNLDTSLRVFGGYQINRTFAGEIGFTNLGETRGNGVLVKGNAWDASALAAWPIAGALAIYGRLGIYRGNLKGGGTLAGAQEDNYGLTYGAGLQFDVGTNVGLRLDWQEYSGAGGSNIPSTDIRNISLGALWRFR